MCWRVFFLICHPERREGSRWKFSRMKKQHTVYLLANQRNTVLYVGVTSDLVGRIYQHKNKVYKGFTSRYNVDKLVYFENWDNPNDAIAREKQIKGWRRAKKEAL